MKTLLIILLTFSFNLLATVPNLFQVGESISAEKINQNFQKSNNADFDSGWFPVDLNTTSHKAFTHNFNAIPSQITVFVAGDVPEGGGHLKYIKTTNLKSISDQYSSPENISYTLNKVYISLYKGDRLLYCDSNNPCYDINTDVVDTTVRTYKKGQMRILLWK